MHDIILLKTDENMRWADFKKEVETELHHSPGFRVNDENGVARMLFRGQANSAWQLTTTLERFGNLPSTLRQYMRDCASARRLLGNISSENIIFDESFDCEYGEVIRALPNYEYIAFLRHHGFPSPLLDWTASPYVAAFFAFRSIQPDVEKVAIYGYRSHVGHGKGFCEHEPAIFVQGPFASIHERHLAQQCNYTFCIKDSELGPEFCSHHDCFGITDEDDQDLLTKWEIDAADRDLVLGELFQMNITPFSLFRSIDGAAETAALKILK